MSTPSERRDDSPPACNESAHPVRETSTGGAVASNHLQDVHGLPALPVFADVPELPNFASMSLEERFDTNRIAHLSDEDLGMHLPGASRLYDDFFGPPSQEDGGKLGSGEHGL
jgi:hypothetical protein